MRLIDADALIERMYHDAFETDTDMQKWDSGCWIRYKMFENAIDDAPTIDAVEMVHGEWIESNLIKDGRIFLCSNCNMAWVSKKRTMDGMNYCPYCGADMRERKESE